MSMTTSSRAFGPRSFDPNSFRLPKAAFKEVAKALFSEIGPTHALSAWVALESEDYSWFTRQEFAPHRFVSAAEARKAYQVTDFLRKYPSLPGGPKSRDRAQEAIRKGRLAELQCKATNRRLVEHWTSGKGNPPPGADVMLRRIQRKIKFVLDGGDERSCSFTVGEWLRSCRWGKGVTDKTGRLCSVYNKFDCEPSFTRRAARFASLLIEADPTWRRHVVGETDGVATPLVELSPGNRITTVPKTAQTDRLIAIEPHWNIYFQLGVGQMIRRRLRRVGIDLSTQETNRQAALEGSRSLKRATIDLSSASDTVSLELVRLLLPPAWFEVLDSLRSVRSFWPDTGAWEVNHKFSSMGNGFTFELETLIFWAIAKTAVELAGDSSKVPVYGDDIIVPSSTFTQVIEWLEYFGFTVNTRKSFATGPFRESCGMNAFLGEDITPFRLVSFRTLSDAYVAHNALLERGYTKTAKTVLNLIPHPLRRFGPRSLGDAVLHSDDITRWRWSLPRGSDQYWFWSISVDSLVFEPFEYRVSTYEPALLYSWYTTSSEDACLGRYSLREKGRWRFRRSLTLGREAHEDWQTFRTNHPA